MCIVVGPADPGHWCVQILAGFLFGLAVGYCESLGLFGLAHTITVTLFILTLMDHFGAIVVPWGYHGRGYEPGRFRRRGISMGELIWELIAFIFNNCVLYVSFVMFYALFSGHVVVSRHAPGGHYVVWRREVVYTEPA